jgi:hypothetical protein
MNVDSVYLSVSLSPHDINISNLPCNLQQVTLFNRVSIAIVERIEVRHAGCDCWALSSVQLTSVIRTRHLLDGASVSCTFISDV